jgi:hypothetical protein
MAICPCNTVCQRLCLVQRAKEFVGVEEIIHVDYCPKIWQLESKPHNMLCCRGKIMMLVHLWDIMRLGTLIPKGESIVAIAYGIALKAIAFALVQDPDLEAQAALETDCLFVDSDKLPRQSHAALLLVQFVKTFLNLPE